MAIECQGNKNLKFSPEGPLIQKTLRCENLHITEHENVNISTLSVKNIQ